MHLRTRKVIKIFLVSALVILYSSCDIHLRSNSKPLFNNISSKKTGVKFENILTETDSFNYFLFSYIYMGGGVSVADFNGDGLTDIYFVGNMVSNKLYLNTGNLRFKDVTDISGTGGDNRWMLGSTVCDINNDGWPDIYVSVSGLSDSCKNLLFVNQGLNADSIPIFSEKAEKYGIADIGKSTQSVFFDYDNDGDMDLYVANYPITAFKSPPFVYRQMMKNIKMKDSDHLFRNNGDGAFTNVTVETGLLSFGLTLSVTVSDFNKDGFKDIYISNDFTSPDYFFINNGNGTFTDKVGEVLAQTSFYGMGADVADYNNDGLLDILQIDMMPEDNTRAKTNMSSMDLDDFEEMLKEGFYHQYRYSTLQLNRGINENGLPYFSNAGWIAGVTSTDWSWAALFADFNLDGWKDLYITNGSRRDMNNLDYFNKMTETTYFAKNKNSDSSGLLEKALNMPSKQLTNYIYKNNGDLTFTRYNKEWGMPEKSYSNGVAYADLDNDGDLELIVNNIDQKAFIYNNNAVENKLGNYLKLVFKGTPENRMGIGSVVTIWNNDKMQMAELTLSRGYESSMEPILYFGLAKQDHIDSLQVLWSNGKTQLLKNIRTNQKITLRYTDAGFYTQNENKSKPIFEEITNTVQPEFLHKENTFNDYKKQVLLPYKLSQLGPCISVGDVNGDGLEDFFIGNAAGASWQLYIQVTEGNFIAQEEPCTEDKSYEDIGSVLFDADGDNDLDLYVVSGGYEFPKNSQKYTDRLYINNGKGIFLKNTNALPSITSSGSCVEAIDFDNDGDLDLFVGGRQIPGEYPFPANSYILENNSKNNNIKFEDVTASIAPDLLKSGMVTSAFCSDIDNDNWTDIVIAGEWMPICYLKNNNGKFEKTEMEGTRGWWFSLNGADFDNDGDIDIIAGNLGLNHRYKANIEYTFDVYAGDFNNNGNSDVVLSYFQNGKQYPLRGRKCFVKQNPWIESKFPTYESFGEATVSEIYTKKVLNNSLHLKSETFASCYFENTGNGNFKLHKLPNEAQLSSINGIIIDDFNNDGHLDILAAGNLYNTEIVTPRNDGSVGVYLTGNGKGSFEVVPARLSGFLAPYDVKALSLIRIGNHYENRHILVGNNNNKLQVFKLK